MTASFNIECFVLFRVKHVIKQRGLMLSKIGRFSHLLDLSCLHHYHSVIVHDGVQAVGNGHYGTGAKAVSDNFLNQIVGFLINTCSSLIQDYDPRNNFQSNLVVYLNKLPGSPAQSSNQANQLLFSLAKVFTTFTNFHEYI